MNTEKFYEISMSSSDLKTKIKLLKIFEDRIKKDNDLNITKNELKKMITLCNEPTNLENTIFCYLLLLFAIKIMNITDYLSQLTTTKTYLDSLHAGKVDKEILDVYTEEEIINMIKLYIPTMIKRTEYEIQLNKKYKEEKLNGCIREHNNNYSQSTKVFFLVLRFIIGFILAVLTYCLY